MLIDTSSTLRFKTIQVNWIFVLSFRILYNQTFRWRKSESRVNRTRIKSAQEIFFNITRRQAILPVANFHHVLGRGLMIRRVILIFIKCFSANQNQLFYMKV